jgi:hypothetical protein
VLRIENHMSLKKASKTSAGLITEFGQHCDAPAKSMTTAQLPLSPPTTSRRSFVLFLGDQTGLRRDT